MRYQKLKYEYLYLMAFACYMAITMYQYTFFNTYLQGGICKILRYLCYLVFVVKIFQDRLDKYQIILMGGIAGITVISSLKSGNSLYLYFMLAILAAKDVDPKRLMKVYAVIQIFVVWSTVLASQVGMITDNIYSLTARGRHGLGFNWVTYAPIMFLFGTMAYLYIRDTEIQMLEYVILLMANIWLFVMTNTRMAFGISVLAIACSFVVKYGIGERVRRLLERNQILILCIPFFAFAVAFALHYLYSPQNALLVRVNDVINGRLRWGRDGITNFGIHLFGQPITWIGMGPATSIGRYNYVDCSYLQIMLEHGLVFIVTIVCMYTGIVYRALKKRDWILEFMLILVLIFSITEPRLLNLAFNPFPLLFLCLGDSEDQFSSAGISTRI